MSFQTAVRHLFRASNDARAVSRASSTRSPSPLVKRVGWRMYGKATGRLGGRLFK